MNSNKLKSIIGYEKLDHVITGFILGLISIGLIYYLQVKFYSTESLGTYAQNLQIPFLKRSLLGALAIFLIFNYLNKLFAMKGVLFSLILVGLYLVIKMFG